ncbi:ribokinase [Brachybacterium paraconglomeratum]|uniref:ribokinase n=1 Tax=Brachybacterium paraconglomeratum TaxID=173362 RepID=UPI0031E9C25A
MSSSQQSGQVLVIGSATVDLTTFSARLPGPGETLLGDAFSLVMGGKGANQAVAAARAGAETRFVGCVGDDLFAPLVREGLSVAGVELTHLREVPGQTGIAHIRVDGAGENDIVMVPLANDALGADQIDAALDEAAPTGGVLLTQLEIPAAATLHAIRGARARGFTVVLDPAPARELDEQIWPLIDVVTPNETEAALLTGIAVAGREEAVRAGRWFLQRGVGAALITMAGAGSVLVTRDEVLDIAPHPVTVVDTTAAGDAFAGYLAAGLAGGQGLTDAIQQAGAAGAIAVTRRGASPSIPGLDEVQQLLADGVRA